MSVPGIIDNFFIIPERKINNMKDNNGFKLEVPERDDDLYEESAIWIKQLEKLIGDAKTLVKKAFDVSQLIVQSGM